MTLSKKVEELSGENLYACYQCGKCSAGCPMVNQMDILPNQIILFILREKEDISGIEEKKKVIIEKLNF